MTSQANEPEVDTGRRVKHVASREVSSAPPDPAAPDSPPSQIDPPQTSITPELNVTLSPPNPEIHSHPSPDSQISLPDPNLILPDPSLSLPEPNNIATATPMVIDPTAYGRRRRRLSHHVIYRTLQIFVAAAFLCATATLLFSFDSNDLYWGGAFGISAALLSIAAFLLSNANPLALRLKGYAVAASVFSALVLIIHLYSSANTKSPDNPLTTPDTPSMARHKSF